MSERNTVAHFLHDAGLAAWFGGSLMGAIGVNGAAADVDDPRQRARVANSGWARWTPFNAVAIGAHLLGGARLMQANKGRVVAQKGVLGNTKVKLALTAGALGATAYARLLGQKVMDAGDVPIAGGTEPLAATPPEVAKAQKQLKALQWAIPGLTGAVLASSSLHEEQQRPAQTVRGTLQKLPALAQTAAQAAVPVMGKAAHDAAPVVRRAAIAAGDATKKAADRVSDKISELTPA